MSRTITHKRSHRSPPGDTVRLCSYCGIAWYRSQLRRDASGNLACPDDQKGRDVVTLNEGNAAALANRQLPGQTGMPSDGTVDSKSTDVAPPFNWNAPNVAPPNGGPTGQLSVLTRLWVRADVVTLGSGGAVAVWPDRSGSQNDLLASTLAAQPVLSVSDPTLGGLPTVTGDGVNHFLQATVTTGGPWWFWLIAKQIGYSNGAVFSWGFGLQQQVASPELRLIANGAPHTSNAAGTLGAWFRAAGSFNIATTDTLKIHGTTVSDASAGQRAGVALSMFSGFNGAGKVNLAAAELLITTPAPTAAEIATLDAYGLARYGGSPF